MIQRLWFTFILAVGVAVPSLACVSDAAPATASLGAKLQQQLQQADWAAAERLLRASLPADPKALTMADLDHATTLARVLDAQRRPGEADPWRRAVLALVEQSFGIEHPRTLAALAGLATTLEEQGEFAVAEPLRRRILTVADGRLCLSYPVDEALALADVLVRLGKQEEASALFWRALAMLNNPRLPAVESASAATGERRAVLRAEAAEGFNASRTLQAVGNLAAALRAEGRPVTADFWQDRLPSAR